MNKFSTEQEEFWAGDFGDQYTDRNIDDGLIDSNILLFTDALKEAKNVNSLIEFGANAGFNLIAIKKMLPAVALSAIEINDKAAASLAKIKDLKVYHESILDFQPDYQRDLVLIKGVLIHINPEKLAEVYDRLVKTSRRYICVIEYYNPVPVPVRYRGHENRLFKRDFAGEILDKYPDWELVSYGFKYRRENPYYDDLTWFLLRKKDSA